MTQELKPCPWCGSADHLSVAPYGSLTSDMPARPYRVVCNHIDCQSVQGPVAYGKPEAVTAWNTRTPIETEGEKKMRRLLVCLLENEPDDLIADGGVTVLDQWRNEARASLGGQQ